MRVDACGRAWTCVGVHGRAWTLFERSYVFLLQCRADATVPALSGLCCESAFDGRRVLTLKLSPLKKCQKRMMIGVRSFFFFALCDGRTSLLFSWSSPSLMLVAARVRVSRRWLAATATAISAGSLVKRTCSCPSRGRQEDDGPRDLFCVGGTAWAVRRRCVAVRLRQAWRSRCPHAGAREGRASRACIVVTRGSVSRKAASMWFVGLRMGKK